MSWTVYKYYLLINIFLVSPESVIPFGRSELFYVPISIDVTSGKKLKLFWSNYKKIKKLSKQ